MCQRCVEDLSDTGQYSWRNAEPEELEAKVTEWTAEMQAGFLRAYRAQHGPGFCGVGYCPVCLERQDEPYDDRPHGEIQPIIDRMEAGDPNEERYEEWLDSQEAGDPDFTDDEEDAPLVLGEAENYRQAPEWEQDEDSLRDYSE